MAEIDLGVSSHLDALFNVLEAVHGLEVVDVGCGEGDNARAIAAGGARVHGFDPFIEGRDWVTHEAGSYRLVRASAEALPIDDRSADVVVFFFSLHHVPQAKLAAALDRARRTLKPSGRLLVAEPLATGPSYYVSAPYHDEGPVRAAAAAALAAHAAPYFGSHRRLAYTERRLSDGFEPYAARAIANRRFNGYTEEAALAPEVRRRFDEMVAAGNGVLDQPVRIDLFGELR